MWLPPTIEPRNVLDIEPGSWFFDKVAGKLVPCFRVFWNIDRPEQGYFTFAPGDAPIVDRVANDFPVLYIGNDLCVEPYVSDAVKLEDAAVPNKAGDLFLAGDHTYLTGVWREEHTRSITADVSSGRIDTDLVFEKPRAVFERWRVRPAAVTDPSLEPLMEWPRERPEA